MPPRPWTLPSAGPLRHRDEAGSLPGPTWPQTLGAQALDLPNSSKEAIHPDTGSSPAGYRHRGVMRAAGPPPPRPRVSSNPRHVPRGLQEAMGLPC